MGKEKVVEDKISDILKEWEEYARKGNWRVRGYKIIRGPSGNTKVGEEEEEEFMISYRPHGVLYHHSLGKVSKFFRGLIEGKLYGTRCPRCGTVYCPPRAHCWNPECRVQPTEWIELPPRGKVHTFSIMLFSADAFLEHLPFVLGYVQIEGAHTALPIQIVAPPTGVWIGQKVNIRFREERKGELMDIYAVPVPGQEPPEWSCLHRDPKAIEDLERNLEETYRFLEERFGITKEMVVKRWETGGR
ncbi:MAG: hypothetical protein DSO02_00350 [Hadesarchaea archaeon]|nr:MAG: hypothetical protein DSO03_00550 [Hadesarchaea archaeon]TDA36470.1 MAG: hypothetical protein DSO02_00350 [Hadesarchaea archaeon]